MATKKIPMRMCVACRQMKEKRERVRIVKTTDGVKAALSGKMAGRGAYVCNCEECVKKLRKQKLIHKTFSIEVDDSVYDAVEEVLLGKK